MSLNPIFLLMIFWLTWFWISGSTQIVPSLLPNMREELSLSVGATSLIPTIFSLGQTVSSFFAGFVCSRIGRKRTILFSLVFVSITRLLLTFTGIYLVMLLMSFFSGIGVGLYLPAAIPFLSEIFPPERRGRFIGLHETAVSISSTVGPIFVSLMFHLGMGWRESMRIWIGPALAIFALQLMMVKEPKDKSLLAESQSTVETEKSEDPDFWSRKHFMLFQSALICRAAGMSMLMFLPIYFTSQLNVDESTAALIVGVTSLMAIFGHGFSGYLSDIFGRLKLLIILNMLFNCVLFALAILPFNPLLITFLFIYQFSLHSFMPVMLAFTSDMTIPAERSKMVGVVFSVFSLFSTIHMSVIGLLAEVSFSLSWIYAVILASLSSILLLLLRKSVTMKQ